MQRSKIALLLFVILIVLFIIFSNFFSLFVLSSGLFFRDALSHLKPTSTDMLLLRKTEQQLMFKTPLKKTEDDRGCQKAIFTSGNYCYRNIFLTYQGEELVNQLNEKLPTDNWVLTGKSKDDPSKRTYQKTIDNTVICLSLSKDDNTTIIVLRTQDDDLCGNWGKD